MNISEVITEYLLGNIIHDVDSIDMAQPLIDSGLIDSISIVKVILFIEKTFGVSFSEEDLLPEYYETVDSMVNLINQKLTEAKNI